MRGQVTEATHAPVGSILKMAILMRWRLTASEIGKEHLSAVSLRRGEEVVSSSLVTRGQQHNREWFDEVMYLPAAHSTYNPRGHDTKRTKGQFDVVVDFLCKVRPVLKQHPRSWYSTE